MQAVQGEPRLAASLDKAVIRLVRGERDELVIARMEDKLLSKQRGEQHADFDIQVEYALESDFVRNILKIRDGNDKHACGAPKVAIGSSKHHLEIAVIVQGEIRRKNHRVFRSRGPRQPDPFMQDAAAETGSERPGIEMV